MRVSFGLNEVDTTTLQLDGMDESLWVMHETTSSRRKTGGETLTVLFTSAFSSFTGSSVADALAPVQQ